MASQALVCAHNNIFNRSILGEDAFYFDNAGDVAVCIREKNKAEQTEKILANESKIKEQYSWDKIINQYEEHFKGIFNSSSQLRN